MWHIHSESRAYCITVGPTRWLQQSDAKCPTPHWCDIPKWVPPILQDHETRQPLVDSTCLLSFLHSLPTKQATHPFIPISDHKQRYPQHTYTPCTRSNCVVSSIYLYIYISILCYIYIGKECVCVCETK